MNAVASHNICLLTVHVIYTERNLMNRQLTKHIFQYSSFIIRLFEMMSDTHSIFEHMYPSIERNKVRFNKDVDLCVTIE